MTPPPPALPESDAASLGRRVLLNAGALSGSSLWRIGVSFVLQLLIARILGVHALGVYTVALAYLNVGQVISELGLPALLSRDLAPQPTRRRAWFRLALRAQLIAAFLVWAGLTALAFLLPYDAQARWALILIGASLPLYAVTSASQTLFRAAERMELVMGVEMFINLLILVVSVLLLLTGTTVLHLIALLIATQAVSAVTCLLVLQRSSILAPPQESVDATLRDLWQRAAPFFTLSIAEVLQQRADILLLSIVAGPAVTGIYSAAYNLARILVKLIQSFWQALYPTLSRLDHEANPRYGTLSDLSLRYGLLALLPVAALTSGVAPDLIRLVYTEQYATSAPVLRWLIWTTPLYFISAYAVTQLLVQRQATRAVGVIGVSLVAILILLPPLAARNGADGAASASVLASAVGALVGVLALHRHGIRFHIEKTGWLLVAAATTALIATLLPLPWLVRSLIALAAYGAAIWFSGALSAADANILRRVLRPNAE